MDKLQPAGNVTISREELVLQNYEKVKNATELAAAYKELQIQSIEKEKRAEELARANKLLVFKNEEKEKLAAALTIANQKLQLQYEEKEKRAAELDIAYKILFLQKEEKQNQAAELEQAVKELESFSYSVSHDLRAPLRAINGFSKVLAEDYIEQLDDEAKVLLDEIIANSTKMGELIDNLLEFSRLNKQHIARVNVDVHKLVNAVIAELRQLEPDRIFDIRISKLENVSGDRNMLRQVFINLLSNAFKYTGKTANAFIGIGSYQHDGQCIYYVKDNGAGFDMLYYDKLFGVFQRLHSSLEFDGTGVGLAIVHKIVAKHQGSVWAEGDVGKGACFYVSLPLQ
jgi:light-regulated signal transduction histidine kinase (bacteriophytochrome)